MEGRGYWRVGQFVHGLLHRINIFNNTVIDCPGEGGGERVLEGRSVCPGAPTQNKGRSVCPGAPTQNKHI